MSHLTKWRTVAEIAKPGPATFLIPALSMALIFLTMNFTAVQAQSHAPDLNGVQAQPNVPDFNGVWAREVHGYPKPYYQSGRSGNGSGRNIIEDGYDNEYLKPWVVELLERDELVTASGRTIVTPHSICYPESVPYIYGGTQVQILQTPDEITMIYGDQGQWRTIYMNRPHLSPVVPSWWGDSVGHFEGDTLVIDTVGLAVNPQAGSMGRYGTPHSEGLHLIERWRFLRDGETSTAPPPRNASFDAAAVVEGGKDMRLTFTLEDPVAYRKPWSVTIDYYELDARLREFACAENSHFWDLAPLLPTAVTPDF